MPSFQFVDPIGARNSAYNAQMSSMMGPMQLAAQFQSMQDAAAARKDATKRREREDAEYARDMQIRAEIENAYGMAPEVFAAIENMRGSERAQYGHEMRVASDRAAVDPDVLRNRGLSIADGARAYSSDYGTQSPARIPGTVGAMLDIFNNATGTKLDPDALMLGDEASRVINSIGNGKDQDVPALLEASAHLHALDDRLNRMYEIQTDRLNAKSDRVKLNVMQQNADTSQYSAETSRGLLMLNREKFQDEVKQRTFKDRVAALGGLLTGKRGAGESVNSINDYTKALDDIANFTRSNAMLEPFKDELATLGLLGDAMSDTNPSMIAESSYPALLGALVNQYGSIEDVAAAGKKAHPNQAPHWDMVVQQWNGSLLQGFGNAKDLPAEAIASSREYLKQSIFSYQPGESGGVMEMFMHNPDMIRAGWTEVNATFAKAFSGDVEARQALMGGGFDRAMEVLFTGRKPRHDGFVPTERTAAVGTRADQVARTIKEIMRAYPGELPAEEKPHVYGLLKELQDLSVKGAAEVLGNLARQGGGIGSEVVGRGNLTVGDYELPMPYTRDKRESVFDLVSEPGDDYALPGGRTVPPELR